MRTSILHIIGQLSFGGAERQLSLLTRELADRYKFIVLFYDQRGKDFVPDLTRAGAEVRFLSKKPGIMGRLRFLRELSQIIRETEPEIVQTWMVSPNLWGRLACILSGTDSRIIASTRKIDFLLLEKFADRILSRWTDVIISNTEVARKLMIHYGVPAHKIRVVANGIRPEEYDLPVNREALRQELNIPPGKTILGTVGRMVPVKDHLTFLAMARELWRKDKTLHFVLVGDGPLRSKIEQAIKNYGLEQAVTLLGSRRDVARVVKIFDVFILTSIHEGFPNVIMEAMCAHLPVIATKVGGVPELVHHGVNGLLVDYGDFTGLVQTVESLLVDRERRLRLGQEGRRSIEERFSLLRMVHETAAIYDEIVDHR